MSKSYKLTQKAWFGDTVREISFPSEWDVSFHGIVADELPVMAPDQIREVLGNPIGSPSIKELARDRKEVVIIFDDISRPTPSAEIIPFVLAQLEEAGIEDRSIRFIAALGAHGAHTRLDFEKKLGAEVIKRFPVYNHNPYENCSEVGTTSRGTVVSINDEVLKCDMKIGIGSILPHPLNGFGGGGKIILPGVASMKTIQSNHILSAISQRQQGLGPVEGLGRFAENQGRMDMEEAAELAGLDFKIDALVNSKRQLVGLVAGNHIKAHHRGAEQAMKLYGTTKATDVDVAVVNANAKANEAFIAVWFAAQSLKEQGGDLVLIVDSPIGQITHYLLGAFGTQIGGSLWNPQGYLPDNVNRVIVFSSYPDYSSGEWFGSADRLYWVNTWDGVMDMLKEQWGHNTRAALYIDGTMQFFK